MNSLCKITALVGQHQSKTVLTACGVWGAISRLPAHVIVKRSSLHNAPSPLFFVSFTAAYRLCAKITQFAAATSHDGPEGPPRLFPCNYRRKKLRDTFQFSTREQVLFARWNKCSFQRSSFEVVRLYKGSSIEIKARR